jgi:glutathione S-transferase
MQLIGMLDSPFVRRVAISLQVLGLPFKHRSVSVFRGFDEFRGINPVVKAPTFVTDDGTVLMDSSLVLQYAESLVRPRTLWPAEPAPLARALRIVGLSLAACEKTAQIVYERGLRPAEKQHQPWVDRVSGQLQAAYTELEAQFVAEGRGLQAGALDQAAISAAVAWHFTQQMLPGCVAPGPHPALVALSQAAEQLPEFQAAPYGDGTVAGAA